MDKLSRDYIEAIIQRGRVETKLYMEYRLKAIGQKLNEMNSFNAYRDANLKVKESRDQLRKAMGFKD